MKKAGLVIFAVVLALTLTFIIADSNQNSTELQSSLNAAKCKADLAVSILGIITSSDSSAVSLMQYSTNVQESLKKLEVSAANNDLAGYKQALKDNFDADIKSEESAILAWKNSTKLSLNSLTRVKADYAVVNSKYQYCIASALSDYIRLRISNYESIIANYQTSADNLKAKGVDVSEMEKVLIDARLFVKEIKELVVSTSNPAYLEKYLNKYSLLDSSADNFYFSPKWELAKLKSAEKRIKEILESEKIDAKADVDTLDSMISHIEKTLSDLGTNAYSAEQKASLYNSINSAKAMVKTIRDKMGATI